VSQSIGAAERVFEILDQEIEIKERENAVELATCRGDVRFEGMSFAYNPQEPILTGIDLHVAPGEVVALVGPSGAGKSTFVNLIPRFFEVSAGRILVDGHDVRDLTLASLRRQIGMVHQETQLFSGTIEDNIRLGRLDATSEEVVHAATLANAHTFIEGFPERYQTQLGERGVNLSGGQAQRLALARAFLKNPAILILDEATSALDSETENLIRESLARLMIDRTTFIIAHRLSTVVNAHKIVVLQQGHIVEWGSHQLLLQKKGVYSQLYQAQYSQMGMEVPA